jgi:hypothetical protein
MKNNFVNYSHFQRDSAELAVQSAQVNNLPRRIFDNVNRLTDTHNTTITVNGGQATEISPKEHRIRRLMDGPSPRPEECQPVCVIKFYVVRTVHFGMKLYNDQRNAQVCNLFIYLLLPYMFRAFF